MNWQTAVPSMRRGLGAFLLASLALLTILLTIGAIQNWHTDIHSFDDDRAQLILTAICFAVGAWLAGIQLGAAESFPRLTKAGLIAIVVSQIGFLLLVWTDWKAQTWLWRLWWIAMVGSVTTTHIILLFSRADERTTRLPRITAGCALIACALLMALALRRDLLATPSTAEFCLLLVPAAGAVLGSIALWMWTRLKRTTPIPGWFRTACLSAGFVIIFLIGAYLGRVTTPPPSLVELFPSNLGELPPDKLNEQVAADLSRLKAVAASVDELMSKNGAARAELQSKLAADNRSRYLPDEEDQLRAQFMSYLAHRAALLRLMANYSGFASVKDEKARSRCFLVGFAAGTTLFKASRQLIDDYRQDPIARKKLNEGDVNWGIPPNMFERIYVNATYERNQEICDEMTAYFKQQRQRWQDVGVFDAEDGQWLDQQIQTALAELSGSAPSRPAVYLDRIRRRVKEHAYTPVYATQSMVSTWIGDTKILDRKPLIQMNQITALRGTLQPGDILLERRNWYLSNAFLPGFWPHAALYVGDIDDLAALGIVTKQNGAWTSDESVVRARLPQYLQTRHGKPQTVIESVSEGVIFNSLEESMHADYVAVLRPRLSAEEKARAIVRAFSHQGKPYDFEFDFDTADKLVCTELVYRSYEGMLDFDLKRIMGRSTLPALEIARKFARELDTPQQKLDFVAFLDAVLEENRCRPASADAFCASCERKRAFNE